MERWDARPFQQAITSDKHSWNVFELESRKYLRSKIHELIELTNHSTLSTKEIQQRLYLYRNQFGKQFSLHLIHALQRTDRFEREAVIWLLLQLNDHTTIPLLEILSRHPQQARTTRLSAALVLAGMGVTREMVSTRPPRLYALS
jgi:hypothetical protein